MTIRAELLLVFALLTACSDSGSARRGAGAGETDAEVAVSRDPDSLPENQSAIIGKVFDYLTGEPVGDAFVSTFPPTETVRTNSDGEFVLTEGLVPGQIFEVKGEADGYERRFVPARPVPGERVTINLPLVPADRAVPVRFEPAVLVFTSDLQEVRVTASNTSDGEENLTFEPPPWLARVGEAHPLPAGGRQTLTFRIAPDAFATAVAELKAGGSLSAEVRVADAFDRVGLLTAIAVPAPPGLVTLLSTGPDALVVSPGSTVDVALTTQYAELPLLGAVLRAETDAPALALDAPERTTGEDGVAVLRIRGAEPGVGTVRVSLPAYPDVKPVTFAIEVRPIDPDAPTGPCAIANGGCGDPTLWRCELSPDGGPDCVDIDECAVAHGGCKAGFTLCVNQRGAPPLCEDVDECEVGADGRHGCGVEGYVTCRNIEAAEPMCDDIDECDEVNGGCGDPWHHRCENVEGAPPVCVDFAPCVPDADGGTYCGSIERAECVDHPGAEPTCRDFDECVPRPDGGNGCGRMAGRWTCVNRDRAPPDCTPIDACATENGGCTPAERFDCVDHLDALPECVDVDECMENNGGCGPRELNVCTNVRGGPPACAPRDLCAPDADFANACGDARYTLCEGPPGEYPTCGDLLECAIAPNGRNGCPGLARESLCFERDGAPPDCVPCPAGFANLDADDQSCEYACVAAAEVCNGRDDDCDGRVDDLFDLLRDPENCGACGHACGGGEHVVDATCRVGRCGALRCEPGFHDADGAAENGCEVALPADVLYVDGPRADPAGDGTAAHPFSTIAEAIALTAGGPGRVISVAAGAYPECVALVSSGTWLLGAGSDRTTLTCDASIPLAVRFLDDIVISGFRVATQGQYSGVDVTAGSRISLSDLSVVGYSTAVGIVSTNDVTLRGLRVIDTGRFGATGRAISITGGNDIVVSGVEITGVRGPQGDAVGLEVVGLAQGVRVEGVRIEDVATISDSGQAMGLDIGPGVRNVQIRDVTIEGIAGGAARAGLDVSGAAATGFRIGGGAELVSVERLTVTGVSGGAGAETAGGDASGVDVGAANAVTLSEVDVRTVVAGAGAPGGVATGLKVVGVTASRFENVLVFGVVAPQPNAGVIGLSFDGIVDTVISHVTVAEVGTADEAEAAGVIIGPEQTFSLAIEDSLVSGVRGHCIEQTAARDVLTLGASLLHDCGDPTVLGAYTAERPPLVDDPRFRGRAAGDLHLAGDSPAVDAAAPGSGFDREPDPNGGRADLGRYGNTAEATPSP